MITERKDTDLFWTTDDFCIFFDTMMEKYWFIQYSEWWYIAAWCKNVDFVAVVVQPYSQIGLRPEGASVHSPGQRPGYKCESYLRPERAKASLHISEESLLSPNSSWSA